MKTEKIEFTHSAWFFFCPIMVAWTSDEFGDMPTFKARYKYLEWLMDLMQGTVSLIWTIQELLGHEPSGIMLRGVKPLKLPFVIHLEE